IVSEGYFRTVGMSLLRGRTFTAADAGEASDAVVINQSMARHYWGTADPIGARVSLDRSDHWLTIVGVVGDVKQYGLDRDANNELYRPWDALPIRDMRLALRTAGDPNALGPRIRDAVRRLDPAQPVVSIETLEQFRDESLASPRLTTILLVIFAAVALAVAATGLLGVIAFSVTQRTQEIAIRLALGAERARVLRLVVGQGLTLATCGLTLGLIGALTLANV